MSQLAIQRLKQLLRPAQLLLRSIAESLAAQGQYLPFDPMLVASGATLDGTVASGVSGPGRFRFGGFRDFILAVQLVDGAGRLLRMGGKVVKNAAGFDLPKFFVGSHPDINTATIEVLTRNGVEVVVPRAQGCCGGLAWHTGDLRAARSFAKRNLNAFPADVDAVLTNAAGCGNLSNLTSLNKKANE